MATTINKSASIPATADAFIPADDTRPAITTTTTPRLVPMVTAPQRVDAFHLRRVITGSGSHFFDPAAMRFFRSRTARTGWQIPCGTATADGFEPAGFGVGHWVLVTSEQFEDISGARGARLFTVRHWIVTDAGRRFEEQHGEFQEFATSAAAHRAAERLARSLAATVTR
jgi:hypothetical protein